MQVWAPKIHLQKREKLWRRKNSWCPVLPSLNYHCKYIASVQKSTQKQAQQSDDKSRERPAFETTILSRWCSQVKEETRTSRSGKLNVVVKNDVTLIGVDYDWAQLEMKLQIQNTRRKLKTLKNIILSSRKISQIFSKIIKTQL